MHGYSEYVYREYARKWGGIAGGIVKSGTKKPRIGAAEGG